MVTENRPATYTISQLQCARLFVYDNYEQNTTATYA